MYYLNACRIKQNLKIPKEKSEAVNLRRIENTMAERKRIPKKRLKIHIIAPHRKLKFEQHENLSWMQLKTTKNMRYSTDQERMS